jgi:hypothetical protein
MSVSAFRTSIKEVVDQVGLSESNWTSPLWEEVSGTVDDEVLNDAHVQQENVRGIFNGIAMKPREEAKQLPRVQAKVIERRTGNKQFFKAVNDFIAFQVPCRVPDIASKIDQIREVVLAHGGKIELRGAGPGRPYGAFLEPDKVYSDIVQYVHVYFCKFGYPIEFQVGEEFAFHTFAVDSARRDYPGCGKVDLWKDGFYGQVKRFILDKANGRDPGQKQPIQDRAAALHQGDVPADLQRILTAL